MLQVAAVPPGTQDLPGVKVAGERGRRCVACGQPRTASCVARSPRWGRLPHSRRRPRAAGKYVLDVAAWAIEGQYAEAARAIGTFGQRLEPHVQLEPALMPI